jgi:hypothetical protein
MKHADKIAPVAAAVSALTTLACCLPVAFAAGTATAGLAVVAGSYRRAFLGASVVLLALGAWQFARARRECQTRSTTSMLILGLSSVIVILVLFFPQLIAGLIADWMP